ncbi:hypothetical protein SRHO_G00115150 [Serrasalmus rhombeus]
MPVVFISATQRQQKEIRPQLDLLRFAVKQAHRQDSKAHGPWETVKLYHLVPQRPLKLEIWAPSADSVAFGLHSALSITGVTKLSFIFRKGHDERALDMDALENISSSSPVLSVQHLTQQISKLLEMNRLPVEHGGG